MAVPKLGKLQQLVEPSIELGAPPTKKIKTIDENSISTTPSSVEK